MLDSTFELFTLAASNSLAVFCFCNLIIGIILVSGSPKSNQDGPFPSILSDEHFKKNAVSSPTDSIKVNKQDDDEDLLSSVSKADESNPFPIIQNDEMFNKNAVSSSEKANELIKSNDDDENLWSVSIAMDEITEEESDMEKEEEDEDDELRKRVEEFIEKINRGWRDEKLKHFLNLGQ